MLNIKVAKICLNVAALILPLAISAQEAEQPPAKPSPTMESHVGDLTGHSAAGADLYYRYCWGCHGARGNGDGENAPWVTPLPRNFVAATFKCRSTPTGTLPLDSDVYNPITRGFIPTNMPSWATLTSQNRADLVAFIKTFSARWVTDKPGEPIPVPAEPALPLHRLKHGQALYQKLECWKGHGEEGRGDVPSASTLTDSNDQPIRPYNFYTGYRFKCGTTNSDLYKIFMTGLAGQTLPSLPD